MDAFNNAVGETSMYQDGRGAHYVRTFPTKKLAPADLSYTASNHDSLALLRFIESFRLYLGGSSPENTMDNQVAKHSSSKQWLSKKETWCVEAISNFGIFPISLKYSKVNVSRNVV